ncbi:MAG TPA: class I SAM-dependent methyltransferase [Gemmatimonadaceae bacterium]|nr:class I SAM-dependent methyltransferase [Gemmatimonadaceae bacterium]
MTGIAVENEIRPISHRSTNDKVLQIVLPLLKPGIRVADIGAGEGFFSQLLGEHVKSKLGLEPAEVITACDIFPEYFRYPEVSCLKISPDGRLPYPDESIDVACSLEVIEHVEDQFAFTRELHRILRPGGLAIISTPNVLNLNSRWRNLHSGFATLFDPLLLSSADPVHTSGHINPVSYYYLAYQLRRAGFAATRVEYDRFKDSARFLLIICGPMIWIGNQLFKRRLSSRKKDVADENESILGEMWSLRMLTSRSVIAIARK